MAVVAITAGYAQNALRPDRVSFAPRPEQTSCGVEPDDAAPPVVTLDAADVAQELAAGALPLDARSAEEFARGHVDSAVHLPCASSSRAVEPVLDLARRAGTVVVYGSDEESERLAPELAARLGRSARVVVATGGFEALSRAGVSAESGACTRCQGEP